MVSHQFPFNCSLLNRLNHLVVFGLIECLLLVLLIAFGKAINKGSCMTKLIFIAGILSWSTDSQYICTRNDSMPTVLWIWDIRHLELAAILVHKDPIRVAAWDPTCTRLVLCTGSTHLYMWTPSGAYCVHVPLPQFTITDLKWNSDGSCLLLKDKESFCCAAVPLLPESSEYSSDD